MCLYIHAKPLSTKNHAYPKPQEVSNSQLETEIQALLATSAGNREACLNAFTMKKERKEKE